jgi:hypothetical protein
MPDLMAPTRHIAFGFENKVLNLRTNVKYLRYATKGLYPSRFTSVRPRCIHISLMKYTFM